VRIVRLLAIAVLAVGLSATGAAAAPTAQVHVTSPDGAAKLAEGTPAEFRRGGSPNLTISVDPSRGYQTMDGFGASITDSSAHVLYGLNRRTRRATMESLFSPRSGNGLSFLRQPMGASDFVAHDFYTYDDVPAGHTDYGMRRFSIAHDRAQILPLLRRALALNRRLKVIASPWSAPAWMKTNGSLIGGRLIDDPRIYAAYARYFVKFVKGYRRAGVPVYAVTVQDPGVKQIVELPARDPLSQGDELLGAAVLTTLRCDPAAEESHSAYVAGPSFSQMSCQRSTAT
jgi:glucosylceramidase